jgi:hypothetical protein
MGLHRRARVGIVLMLLLLRAAASPAQTQRMAASAPAVGTIAGVVLDQLDAPIPGARVALAQEEPATNRTTVSGEDGRFSFADVAAGPFRLVVSAAGFAPFALSGVVQPGEITALPPARLTLAFGTAEITVTPTRTEIAERQIERQEHQRVLGLFPNFNVSYDPDPAPLNARQKFQLTWATLADPMHFATTAALAGVQQARNDFSGFGGGIGGYGKRYAALYATTFTGSVLSHAVFPALLKQDPRYIYKGTGGASSRVGYAIAHSVVRTGDNGRTQPDYSRILGHLAAGALSNLYYPADSRHGVGLTLSNTGLAVAGAAAGNLMQEFVLKRFTTHSTH